MFEPGQVHAWPSLLPEALGSASAVRAIADFVRRTIGEDA
jgi:hypothetical protein